MKNNLNTKILWAAGCILLGVVFAAFLGNFISYEKILDTNNTEAKENKTLSAAVIETLPGGKTISKYFYYLRDLNQKPKISAEAYLVGDLNTGEVILSKNQDKSFPIASVSKLMTALVASEINQKEETATKVTRTALATYGSNGNFRTGEIIKIKDLLYPLLL